MTNPEIRLKLPPGKKIYFTSDWHLGYPDYQSSLKREKIILQWLREIETDVYALFLVGDIFDFWFDYKHAAPRNFIRVLGQLARLSDQGVKIFYFFGNHDMWHKDYLAEEIGMQYIPDSLKLHLNDLKMYVAHGDGLGPGDKKYKLLKKIFRNPVSQYLYRILHPDLGIPLAKFFSRLSRNSTPGHITDFLGEEKEHLIQHSQKILEQEHFDYFIYGHRHHVVQHPLNEKSIYLNIGDWLENFSYAESDGKTVELKKWHNSI